MVGSAREQIEWFVTNIELQIDDADAQNRGAALDFFGTPAIFAMPC